MSLPPRLRILLMAGLGLVLLVLLVRGDGGGGEATPQETLQAREARLRQRAAAEVPLVTEAVPLDLEALEPRADRHRVERNPFRYGQVEPPEPPPRLEAPPAPEPEPEPEPVVPAEPPRPQPPSFEHLRFLGSFGRTGQRIGVVVSGEEIWNVREGDVIEGRFTIEEIGYESIALGFVGFPDEAPRRLPAGG